MKKILAILLSLLSCGFLSACSAEKTQPDTPDTETVWEMVSEAYIYAFPLVLTDATKTLSTNTDGTMTGRAPINQFNHAKKLADASFRTVVTPNVDTVYSQAWLDISTEPMVYVLPERIASAMCSFWMRGRTPPPCWKHPGPTPSPTRAGRARCPRASGASTFPPGRSGPSPASCSPGRTTCRTWRRFRAGCS